MEKKRVILNRVKELNQDNCENVDVRVIGESPAIYTPDAYPSKRIQGIIVEAVGSKEHIDEFLNKYKLDGVYNY